MDLGKQDKILNEAIERINNNLDAIANELHSSKQYSQEKGWKNVSMKPDRVNACISTLIGSMGQLKALIPFLNLRANINSETLKEFIK